MASNPRELDSVSDLFEVFLIDDGIIDVALLKIRSGLIALMVLYYGRLLGYQRLFALTGLYYGRLLGYQRLFSRLFNVHVSFKIDSP